MARWRLMQPHYLSVPGTEWEYRETDRETGQQARKVFTVPRFLNPSDTRSGEINVCHEGKGQRGDVTFLGDPTPDMEPLDAEAEAISEALRPNWIHPIESLDNEGGFGASLIASLEKQMDKIAKGQAVSVPADKVAELEAKIAELAEQNAKLQAAFEAKPQTRRL